jgi:hypothetical protein
MLQIRCAFPNEESSPVWTNLLDDLHHVSFLTSFLRVLFCFVVYLFNSNIPVLLAAVGDIQNQEFERLRMRSCGVAMTRISIFVPLILSLFPFETVAQNNTFTITEVDSQVSDFLQLIQNGSISTRGTSTRSLLPSGCTLAVG